MTHTSRLRSVRSRRFKAFIAALALVMIVLGLSGVRPTLAGWTDSEQASGLFSSGQIQPVQNLKCINQGLGGLLSNKVKLEWQPPQPTSPVPFEYEIVVKKTTVVTGTVTTATFSTDQTNFMFIDTNLVNISNYLISVQQKTKDGEWVGAERTVEASGIAVVLGVTMICA